MFGAPASAMGGGINEHFTSAVENYQKFAEGLIGIWPAAGAPDKKQSAVSAYFRALAQQLSEGPHSLQSSWLKQWLQFAQHESLAGSASQTEKLFAHWFEGTDAIPAIGPNRESIEVLQRYQREVLAQQRTLVLMSEHWRQILLAALDQMVERIESGDAPSITTVKELFDLWVDTAESCYEKHAKSERYARDFGDAVNASMRRQKLERQLIGEFVSHYGISTSAEVEALRRECVELKRKLADLENAARSTPKSAATRSNSEQSPQYKEQSSPETAEKKLTPRKRKKPNQKRATKRPANKRPAKKSTVKHGEFAIDDLLN